MSMHLLVHWDCYGSEPSQTLAGQDSNMLIKHNVNTNFKVRNYLLAKKSEVGLMNSYS